MMPFKRSQKKFVYKSVRNQLYILLRKLFPSEAADKKLDVWSAQINV